MQRRTDKKIVFIGIFTFLIVMLLSACGKEENAEIPEKAFGMEYSQEQEFQSPVQAVCNAESVWVITTLKNDPVHKWSPQTAGTHREQIEWQSEEGKYSLISIAEREGTLYVKARNREDDTFEIRKRRITGAWDTIMSIPAENREDYAVMGSSFYVDGEENVYLASGKKVMGFSGEGEASSAFEMKGDVCFWMEDDDGQVECVTAAADGITLYELTENGAEEKWVRKVSAPGACGIRTNSDTMLCLAMDQELLFLDRESGNLLARTDMMKLGVSSILTGYYDETAGTLQVFGIVGNGDGLSYSLLSERDMSKEQRTELVYGMVGGVNKTDTSSIWRAIAAFNQTSQDYYVVIKNYDNNVDRLNADMAAGNGPDIIDMTYSEYYESYARNGYLEELSPYLEQSQYKDDIIWNILDAYRVNGGLYLLTPQVQLTGIAIHPEYEVAMEEWNMETFLKLIEQNRWEKALFGVCPGDPEAMLLALISGRQEELIDWEQGKAFFETEAFVDMLKLCREYAEADWSDAEEWSLEEKMYNTLFQDVLFGGNFTYYLFNADVYGREYPIYGYPTLSGQTYELTACSDSCAIYSGSSRKEGAWAFIESLLWESNQKYSGITNPGFPIRSSVLKELAEESKSVSVRSGGEMLTITDAEICIQEDILYNGKLSNGMLDPDIRSVILEEAASYFAGDKNAEDVAHIIQSRVEIILQEYS